MNPAFRYIKIIIIYGAMFKNKFSFSSDLITGVFETE